MNLATMPFPAKLYKGCGPCVVVVKCPTEPKSFRDAVRGAIVEAIYIEPRKTRRATFAEVEAAFETLEKKYPDDLYALLEGMASCTSFVPLSGATEISRQQDKDYHAS